MDLKSFYLVKILLACMLLDHCSCSEFSSFTELRKALQSDVNLEFASFPAREFRGGDVLEVDTRVVISDVKPIRDDSLDIIVHLQSLWTDKRLTFNTTRPDQNGITLTEALEDNVWTLDTYLEPEWTALIIDEKRSVRVFPSGAVVETRRLQATIPCVTSQVEIQRTVMLCTTRITSYSKFEDEVKLMWAANEPLQLKYGAVDTGSEIERAENDVCEWDTLNDWPSSCLEVRLHVSREFKSIILRLYIPTFMAVMMAWSSFWIHRDETSARIKLGTLVTWTVMTEYMSIEIVFPDYLDNIAGNVWMMGCITFTWISFFLYIFIHVIRRREKARNRHEDEKQKEKDKEEKRTGERALSVSSVHPEGHFDKHGVKGYSVWEHKEKFKLSHIYVSSFRLERWCRIWYGVVFLLFTVVFLAIFGRGLFVD